MQLVSAELARVAADRHGVVSRHELLADGVGADTIRRLVTNRHLVRLHAGVYRWAVHPDRFESRCVAVSMAGSDLIVTGISAGHLWGFRHVPRPTIPVVLAPHARSGLAGAVLLRRTNVLDPIDVVERPDAIRLARRSVSGRSDPPGRNPRTPSSNSRCSVRSSDVVWARSSANTASHSTTRAGSISTAPCPRSDGASRWTASPGTSADSMRRPTRDGTVDSDASAGRWSA